MKSTANTTWSTESEQETSEQARTKRAFLFDKVGGRTLMEDRYYVQRVTEQVFLIRERTSSDGEPRPTDRLVRSFDVRHDAYLYADSLNDRQRKLDEADGHWAQPAN